MIGKGKELNETPLAQPPPKGFKQEPRSSGVFLFVGLWVDLGVYANLQSLCLCQKQPSIKIAVLYFFRIISGLPNTFF